MLPSDVNRRELLRVAGASAGVLLAGCLDSGNGTTGGDTPGTDSPTPTSSPTASPSPTESSASVSGTSFEVVENACGSGTDAATVSFGDHVLVTGTIRGQNTCYTAKLEAADYDAEADRLTVRIRSYVPESKGTSACGQCIVTIDYEAEVRFDGDLPETVAVEHNDKEVAWEQR